MSTEHIAPAGGEGQPAVPGGEGQPAVPGAPASDPGLPGSAPMAAGPASAATPGTHTGTAAPLAAGQRVTRAGVVWAAVVAALVLLILLIIFILQNQEQVAVRYLGLEGSVPLGMALFIASVTGGVLVAIAGGARILQLRYNAHRSRLRQTRS